MLRSMQNSRIAGMKLSFEFPGRVNLNSANLCSGVSAVHCSIDGAVTPRVRAQSLRLDLRRLIARVFHELPPLLSRQLVPLLQ